MARSRASTKTCAPSPSRITHRCRSCSASGIRWTRALPAARALIRDLPGCDIALVVDARANGSNLESRQPRKHARGGAPRPSRPRRQRHAGRSALPRCGHRAAARSARTASSPVSTRASPTGGKWSELGAMHINFGFLPERARGRIIGSGRRLLRRDDRARRETLERIGGFARLRDELADDHRIGDEVRALGLAVVLSPYIVEARVSRAELCRVCGGTSCAGRAPCARWRPPALPGRCWRTRLRLPRSPPLRWIWLDLLHLSCDFLRSPMGYGAGDRALRWAFRRPSRGCCRCAMPCPSPYSSPASSGERSSGGIRFSASRRAAA